MIEEQNFDYTIKIAFMYDDTYLEFENVNFILNDGGLIIIEKHPRHNENTIIPLGSIKYYTIVEPKSDSGLEVV